MWHRLWRWTEDIGFWFAYVWVGFLLACVLPVMFLTGACGRG